jgi:hypothetical protein
MAMGDTNKVFAFDTVDTTGSPGFVILLDSPKGRDI